MRSVLAVMVGAFVLGGVAQAQTGAASGAAAEKGYVEGVAQSAFGNVTSQSYGAELGFTVHQNLQVFVEAGQIRNVATTELGAAAQTIAGGLSQTQANVGFSVKQPVTFGAAGVKFLIPVAGAKAQPYVMAGAGMAKVKQDVRFTIAGADVTSTIEQYGVVLGTDTSGDFTKPMMVFGGGVTYAVWQQLIADFQVRFGRILAEDQAINVSRLGIGIGVRF
jgi:opacity protein-like surface antigen